MIVIPMAGLSRRFTEVGYSLPKYMLQAHGKSLFQHAVESFAAYFDSEPFLFVARDIQGTADFLAREIEALGIAKPKVALLPEPTSGQGETVTAGLRLAGVGESEPITIFNIDTFRPGFRYPVEFDVSAADGYLETFVGSGPNWSNVLPVEPGSRRVARTSEKEEASEYCCTGLYHWRSVGRFFAAYEAEVAAIAERVGGPSETYVAPMYNHLIAEGGDVRFTVIPENEVIFCGVPAEYDAFKARRP